MRTNKSHEQVSDFSRNVPITLVINKHLCSHYVSNKQTLVVINKHFTIIIIGERAASALEVDFQESIVELQPYSHLDPGKRH